MNARLRDPVVAEQLKEIALEAARKWIEHAIAAGVDPRMKEHEDGHWGLEQCAPGYSGAPITSTEELPPLPDDLWSELREVCKSLGRVVSYKKAIWALPFVKDNPDWKPGDNSHPRCFWSVKSTGRVARFTTSSNCG